MLPPSRQSFLLWIFLTSISAAASHDNLTSISGAASHDNSHYYHGLREHHHLHDRQDYQRKLQTGRGRCATGKDNTSKSKQAWENWLGDSTCNAEDCPALNGRQTNANIRVIWHNICKSDGSACSTDIMINSAVSVLNSAFGGTGFSFSRSSTVTTNNDSFWSATSGTSAERSMKSSLRQGGCDTLNIYSTGQTSSLGWATFPSNCAGSTSSDGVVIDYQTSPGGNNSPYNDGDTLVHEVGHWLGLYHTFQGGCSGDGDFVADTPAESSPDYNCQRGRDTCSGGGIDDVTNYMNYGDDACLDHFTTLQIARMQSQWDGFRSGSPSPGPAPGNDAGCFPRNALVDVLGAGATPLGNIQVGDSVLTANGQYEPVYAWGHYNPTKQAEFLRFEASAGQKKITNTKVLEATGDHLVFLQGKTNPVRADSIRVGDVLQGAGGSSRTSDQVVRKISTIERDDGVYSPLTPSGTVVVNGIAASTYIGLQGQNNPEFAEFKDGKSTFLSFHEFVHMTLSPYRMICSLGSLFSIRGKICHAYSEDGVPLYAAYGIKLAQWVERQNLALQWILFLSIGALGGAFLFVENLLSSVASAGFLSWVAGAAGAYLFWMQRSPACSRRSPVRKQP